PFYGESGGQVGDTGVMGASGVRFRVDNTQKKLGNLFVHEGLVEEGEVRLGLALELVVDHERRQAVRANHSATHLLHEALRQVLGEHVAQKGSLVAPRRLRFDFAHQKPISLAELARVEDIANRAVLDNTPVVTHLMGIDEAIGTGARALFGEKYGDEVRVVSMGVAPTREDGLPDSSTPAFSTELCGGTHVSRTGDIGIITIVSETAVAAGVRRIEAKTATEARRHLNARAQRLHDVAMLLKAPEEDAAKRLESIIEESRKLERALREARRKNFVMEAEPGKSQVTGSPLTGSEPQDTGGMQDIGGIKYYRRTVSGFDMKDLKSLADEAKQKVGSGVVA
ncbi:MAG: alanine--tRNA ligase-related protein, partial [Methylocella sp.]